LPASTAGSVPRSDLPKAAIPVCCIGARR
jgi:hypothetical protein